MNLRSVDKSGNSLVQNSRNSIEPEVSVEALGDKSQQIHEAIQCEKKKSTIHKSNINDEKNECPTKFVKNFNYYQWKSYPIFHCNLCDKTITRSSKSYHMKKVHEEKKYECQQCDTLLTSWHDLRM